MLPYRYGLEIDFIGIWNERASDATYAASLRKTLDAAGFSNTKIVAKDGGKDICDNMAADPARRRLPLRPVPRGFRARATLANGCWPRLLCARAAAAHARGTELACAHTRPNLPGS